MIHKQLLIISLFFICAVLFSVKILAKDISILTQKGSILYSVEVADTPQLLRKGLMYRKSMPQNQGMLFVFEKIRPTSMWMKNTYIPLDMLFVDKDGVIRYIHENAQPMDETIITCSIPIKYVIELNSGQVKENEIQVSNQIVLNANN